MLASLSRPNIAEWLDWYGITVWITGGRFKYVSFFVPHLRMRFGPAEILVLIGK